MCVGACVCVCVCVCVCTMLISSSRKDTHPAVCPGVGRVVRERVPKVRVWWGDSCTSADAPGCNVGLIDRCHIDGLVLNKV
jgi:hypothetical protein